MMDPVFYTAASPIVIPEIMQRVFENLPKANLLSPTLTCRSWSETALNILWRDIDRLVPLLQTLAPMCVQNSTWVFENGLVNAKWDRFLLYCNRVRTLEYHRERIPGAPNDDAKLAKETILHLIACMPRTRCYVLPNLVTLRWGQDGAKTSQEFDMALPFVTPSVRRLGLAVYETSFREVAFRIIGSIGGITSGRLLGLSIDTRWCGFPEQSKLSDAHTTCLAQLLRSNPRITSLRIPACSPDSDLLQAVCSLNKLQELHVDFNYAHRDDVFNTLEMLVQHCPIVNLLDLGLYEENDGDASIFTGVPFSVLRPLFGWRSLTHLSLGVTTCVNFDCRDVIVMGQAWPKIEHISIEGRDDDESPTRNYPPVTILTTLAQHLSPTLRSLTLPLSYAGLQKMGNYNNQSFPNMRFMIVCLGATDSVDDEAAVGELLAHLTPDGSIAHVNLSGEGRDSAEGRIESIMAAVRRTRRRAIQGLRRR